MNVPKQFRYALEPLLKKYQWSKETAVLLFNEKNQQLQQEQEKYTELKQAIELFIKDNSCSYQSNGFIDIESRFNMMRYLTQQERLLQMQQDKIDRINKEVAQLREQLKRWCTKEKMLNNYKKRKVEVFLLEQNRQQLNEMDDLWNSRSNEVIL